MSKEVSHEKINEIMLSLKDVGGFKTFIDRYIDDRELFFDDSTSESFLELTDIPVNLSEFKEFKIELKNIIGIDTSSFNLGDTESGYIAVFRGSIIISSTDVSKIIRLGPYLMHITVNNSLDIINKFRASLHLSSISYDRMPSLGKVMDRVRNFFERMIQVYVVNTYSDSLILLDGSLMGGTVDTPKTLMSHIVSLSEKNNSLLVGISKSSSIRLLNGRPLLSLIPPLETGFVNISNYVPKSVREKVFGEIFVSRFRPEGDSFRVDIHPTNEFNSLDIMNILYSSVDFIRGYPHTLEMAHSLSVFRRKDIIALKAYLLGSGYKLNIEGGPDRNYIFPRYGR